MSSTLADRIEAEFPVGVKMPDQLRKLCTHLEQTGYPLSGYNRLRPEGEGLKSWFGERSAAWSQLAGFGAGPDGSTLAFWFYKGQDMTVAPVVHLCSEGVNLFVLADNFHEFLHLLAIGYDELGYDDLTQPPNEPESAECLRRWLHSEFGIVPPEIGKDLVQRAQAKHPDFKEWVYAAQELRDRR